MLCMKVKSNRKLHYGKIEQINFLTGPLIEVVKISNFEIKYLGKFWAQRRESLCILLIKFLTPG